MAKTKQESAKKIRERMISRSPLNVEEESSRNIATAKELTNIAVNIENLSDTQADIFEKMLKTLEEIPSTIRGRERQNEDLMEQIANAILDLEKQLEKETDEDKRGQLQGAIGGLTQQGQNLGNSGRPKGQSLFIEGMASKHLGLRGPFLQEMRNRGGGVKGAFGAYGSALKTGFRALRGKDLGDGDNLFDDKLAGLRSTRDASEQISASMAEIRKGKVRENVENVADYNVAKIDPSTGQYYRESKAGNRIDEFTESGKLNPQFDPAGLVQKVEANDVEDDLKNEKTEDILLEIARNTETTANLLQKEQDAKDKPVDTATSGADFDLEKPVVAGSAEGGFGGAMAGGSITALLTSLIGPLLKKLNPFSGLMDSGKNLFNKLLGRGGQEVGEAALKEGGEVALEQGAQIAAREGGEVALREGGEAVAEKGAQIALREGGEAVAKRGLMKAGGKALLKKIPLIGAVAGIGFGIHRAMKGDFMGALGEVASGAASTIPGAGTAASLAIDAGLAARDIKNALDDQEEISEAGMESAETASQMSEAVEEQRRSAIANELEEQALTGSSATSNQPIINNVDNSQVVNNYGGSEQGGSTTSISVRNDDSSYARFQSRRLSRVM